jgi:hypothetical protein
MDEDYYGSAEDYAEANREERELRLAEAEETLREYYGNDISFAKGKEERMAYSCQMSDGEEEELEWIKNGWKWYDKDEEEWILSPEGRKKSLL